MNITRIIRANTHACEPPESSHPIDCHKNTFLFPLLLPTVVAFAAAGAGAAAAVAASDSGRLWPR